MYKLRFRQIHLDFHTSEKIPGIGEDFDPEQFVATLKAAHVNSITCFSRCHHGLIYHDTRFEARHPHLTCNLLKEQIDACHAADIRVPIYITVGWDEFQAKRHPEWLEVDIHGKRVGAPPLQAGWRKFCFNTPYIDYVLEQSIEVLEMFEVDGLFFDIIAQGQCLCPCCLQGMAEAGLDPECEPHRARFARETLDRFKRRFTEEVRRRNSDCSIFYNAGHIFPDWRPILDTYTHLELESLPSGGWGYLHFPLTMRYARTLGLDCLGMTGKFQKTWGHFSSFKNRAALEYECFTQLALGAKCSVGDQLHPRGSICPATYELIGRVYRSVAEKEEWCEDAEAVCDIALFNPEATGVQDGRVDSSAAGACRILQEAQHQFDVVDAENDWSGYRVLILADKIVLDEELAAKVKAYLDDGGKLLLTHESGLTSDKSRFALDEFGVQCLGPAEYSPDFIRAQEPIASDILDAEHVCYDRGLEIAAAEGAEVLADVYHPYFNRTYEHFCSHNHTPVKGRSDFPAIVQSGNVIYCCHPLFGGYFRHGMNVYKRLLLNCLDRLLPEPLIRAQVPSTVQTTVSRQPAHDRTVVHLLHYIPERRARDIDTIEEAIPLYNVPLALRGSGAGEVYLAPSGMPLECEEVDDYMRVTIPEVNGHEMVVFEGV